MNSPEQNPAMRRRRSMVTPERRNRTEHQSPRSIDVRRRVSVCSTRLPRLHAAFCPPIQQLADHLGDASALVRRKTGQLWVFIRFESGGGNWIESRV